jgi:hypothetical protein
MQLDTEIFKIKNSLRTRTVEKKSILEQVVVQVSDDLTKLLSKSTNIKNKIRLISDKIQIDKKTLQRLIDKKSKPNYNTVFKIYSYLLNLHDDAEILKQSPAIIQTYLKSANPQTFEKNTTYSSNIDKQLLQNPIFCEIYVLSLTGPLSKKEIQKRFGQYGTKLSEQMLQMKVLAEKSKDVFVCGPNQSNFTPETVLAVGLNITTSYSKPATGYDLDQHIISFYCEGLTPEAYQQWIDVDQLAIRKKIEIAERPENKGLKRAFTFTAIDTLETTEAKP